MTDASWNDQLGLAEDPALTEDDARQVATSVAAALDAFLNSAQSGTPDLAPIRAVWTEGRAPEAAATLTTGLTSPDNPVASATYHLDVHFEDGPTLVAADVRIDRRDGTRVDVELVFDVTGPVPAVHLVGTPRRS